MRLIDARGSWSRQAKPSRSQAMNAGNLAHARAAVDEQTRHVGAPRRCQQGFERIERFDRTRVIDPPILAQLYDPSRSVERHDRLECFMKMRISCHGEPIL